MLQFLQVHLVPHDFSKKVSRRGDKGLYFLAISSTDMAKSTKEWKGETGLVDKGMLLRHLTTLQGPIYYIAGPPAMVAGVRNVLVAANVDEDDIRTEARA